MSDFETAREFAQFIKGLGFRVFVAKNDGRRGHGFITDAEGSRVLSFGMEGGLSGNYGPPSRASGTGWQIEGANIWTLKTAEDVKRALYAIAPNFCQRYRKGVPDSGFEHYTTLAEHLGLYGSSSGYQEI
jgi:hypothetical protein